ncbi:hypothetical protein ABIA65_005398 [Mycolicibacterium sp. 624]
MTENAVGRPGSDTETAQKSNASQTVHHDTPAGPRQPASSNASVTIEHRLLALMTTAEAMALVAETGVQAEVFEDLVTWAMFDFMQRYAKDGTPPTALVMQTEFPMVQLPRAVDVEETAQYCCDWLRRRFTQNKVQDIARQSAKMMTDDPAAALRFMEEQAKRAREQAGRTDDDRPKLWNAADLRAAEQPRWLAKNRLPRGAVSLLVGDEGLGKSLFWVYLAAAITTGKPLLEFGVPARDPGHVFVVVT